MDIDISVRESAEGADHVIHLDALVIGAGIAGIYQLHRLRELGLNVRAFETGSGVGGTWYWNRYPGARFDSQVEAYQFWISKELYAAWKPSERYPAQPETERWLNFVADRLDLKKDIQLNTRIVSALYNEDAGRWLVTTSAGQQIDTQYLVACCGMLSAPLTDRFPGQASFKGQLLHTALWPKGEVDLAGKRIAVIGTGATGIQVVQSVAPLAKHLKVFVRTPQYILPMKNYKYDQAEWDKWSSQFDELKLRVRQTFTGFPFDFEVGPWAEKTPAERLAVLEAFWEKGSLELWLGTFAEMFFDPSINEEISEFVRGKMRARLNNDPALCDLLVPKTEDYGFGTHRVPLETKYLEVYLRDNVEGVNCRTAPIERIVPEGIMTADGKVHEVDVIIMALGFDAGSGALSRIDIRGRDGRSLKAQWQQEIRTALGMQVHGYPNLFMTGAPLAPAAALCNMTTCLQQQADWITGCISHARSQDRDVVEVSKTFEDEWVAHHDAVAAATLVVKTDSWYMGSNVEGKPRRLLSYIGGGAAYNAKCNELAETGYPGFGMISIQRRGMETMNAYYGQEGHGPYTLYNIGDLTLEDGGVIPACELAVATFGKLNAAKDNAVLIPTWYSGTNKIIEQVLIGEGRALDPTRYFLIIVNQIGNGLSTSPHNAGGDLAGAAFPHVRIGDDVRAQHKLITENFGIERLALVVGGSMGAQQSYEWAVRYPEMVARVGAIAGTARNTELDFLLAETLIEAITSDPGFAGGSYAAASDVAAGLARHARLWTVSGWSDEFFRQGKHLAMGFDSIGGFVANFMVPYFAPMDPNNLLCMAWKWQRGDVSRHTNGDLAAALGRIKARTFVLPISHDNLFPPADCAAEQRLIPNSELHVLESGDGHLGLFGTDPAMLAQLDTHLKALLES